MQPPWWKASAVSLETSSFLEVDPRWLRQRKPWRGPVQTGKSRQFNGQLCSSIPPQFTVVGSYKKKKKNHNECCFILLCVGVFWQNMMGHGLNLEPVGCCWALVGSLAKCWCLGDGFPCSNRPRPLEKNACSWACRYIHKSVAEGSQSEKP